MAEKQTPGGNYVTIPLSLYPEDLQIIKAAMRRGDELDVRLDRSKTVRLLIRAADVGRISKDQYLATANEITQRRERRAGKSR